MRICRSRDKKNFPREERVRGLMHDEQLERKVHERSDWESAWRQRQHLWVGVHIIIVLLYTAMCVYICYCLPSSQASACVLEWSIWALTKIKISETRRALVFIAAVCRRLRRWRASPRATRDSNHKINACIYEYLPMYCIYICTLRVCTLRLCTLRVCTLRVGTSQVCTLRVRNAR